MSSTFQERFGNRISKTTSSGTLARVHGSKVQRNPKIRSTSATLARDHRTSIDRDAAKQLHRPGAKRPVASAHPSSHPSGYVSHESGFVNQVTEQQQPRMGDFRRDQAAGQFKHAPNFAGSPVPHQSANHHGGPGQIFHHPQAGATHYVQDGNPQLYQHHHNHGNHLQQGYNPHTDHAPPYQQHHHSQPYDAQQHNRHAYRGGDYTHTFTQGAPHTQHPRFPHNHPAQQFLPPPQAHQSYSQETNHPIGVRFPGASAAADPAGNGQFPVHHATKDQLVFNNSGSLRPNLPNMAGQNTVCNPPMDLASNPYPDITNDNSVYRSDDAEETLGVNELLRMANEIAPSDYQQQQRAPTYGGNYRTTHSPCNAQPVSMPSPQEQQRLDYEQRQGGSGHPPFQHQQAGSGQHFPQHPQANSGQHPFQQHQHGWEQSPSQHSSHQSGALAGSNAARQQNASPASRNSPARPAHVPKRLSPHANGTKAAPSPQWKPPKNKGKSKSGKSTYLSSRGAQAMGTSSFTVGSDLSFRIEKAPKEQKPLEEVNAKLIHNPEDQLYFSRKPRPIKAFKLKSTQEYLDAQPKEYYELGKLQADLNTDELIEKRKIKQKVKDYAEKVRKTHSSALKNKGEENVYHKPAEHSQKTVSARQRALEFAKRSVPRPIPHRRRSKSRADELAESKAIPYNPQQSIKELEMKHERARNDIENIKREFGF